MKSRLPAWFKKRIPEPGTMSSMRKLMNGLSLNTICESGICPNMGDCFSKGTATFLLLGDTCTRNCTFCAVKKGIPGPVDEEEPEHLAEAVRQLGLKHVVITSVTRDDLSDGGAAHFARTIRRLQAEERALTVEVLVPDFAGSPEAVGLVVGARPDVINHNLETVPRLYPEVRPKAVYQRSLELLRLVKELDDRIITKSGLMVGLGETKDEMLRVMDDLREVDCGLLTIGQYLAPSSEHHPVVRFVSPDEFSEYEHIGEEMGFSAVASAPLVRSSFDAAHLYARANARLK
jgi:lipoic acid synthetase